MWKIFTYFGRFVNVKEGLALKGGQGKGGGELRLRPSFNEAKDGQGRRQVSKFKYKTNPNIQATGS